MEILIILIASGVLLAAFVMGRISKEIEICKSSLIILDILEERTGEYSNDFFKGSMWVLDCFKEIT